jgi:hypothetical protein
LYSKEDVGRKMERNTDSAGRERTVEGIRHNSKIDNR